MKLRDIKIRQILFLAVLLFLFTQILLKGMQEYDTADARYQKVESAEPGQKVTVSGEDPVEYVYQLMKKGAVVTFEDEGRELQIEISEAEE